MTDVPFADIDVSGEGRTADPAHTRAVSQGVALLLGMIKRIEAEHGPIGLDVLLSAYFTLAVGCLGIPRTMAVLRNIRARLADIGRGDA